MSIELPRHNFSPIFEPAIEAALSSAVDNIPPRLAWQQNWSQQRSAAVRDLFFHQINWCNQNLGLGVHRRIPNCAKIRFLSSETFRRQAYDETSSAHFDAFTGEVNVAETDNEEETLYKLSHEIIHATGFRLFAVRKVLETGQLALDRPQVVGYRRPNERRFRGVNEWLSELMNIDMHSSQDGTRIGEVALQTATIAYPRGVFYLDTIINETAKRLQFDPRLVRKQLYTGLYLDGDTRRLNILDDGLRVRMTELFGLMDDTDYGVEGFTENTKLLGLDLGDKLKDQVSSYLAGYPTTILDGQTVKTTPQ